MAQTYTLDEAAGRLALPTEEFKRRLKAEWKQVRSFRDGPTLRFRAADIDELARVMGGASDPGLQLGPVGGGDLPDPIDASSDDFILSPDVPPAPPPSSKVGKPKPNLKPADDSGVKLDPPAALRPSDSEISLPTEAVSLDLSGPGSSIIRPNQLGKAPPSKPPKPSGMIPKPSGILPRPSGKFTAPPSSKIVGPPGSKGTAGADSSSEFELSLDADSDSFEMQLADDKSEMDLAGLELGPADPKGGGLSGIDLGKPTDSGLSLEAGGPKTGGPQPRASRILPKGGPRTGGPRTGGPGTGPRTDSSIDFELALDSGSSPGGQPSESEFELSLDGGSAGADTGPKTAAPHAGGAEEVFATDFELPSVGDDSSADLDLDGATTEHSSSDFDLAISDADVAVDEESASEVVLVDDEAVAAEDYVEEGEGFVAEDDEVPAAGAALMGVGREDEEADAGPVRYAPAAPAEWGVLPVAVLLPSLLLVFVGGLMSFELLRGMWGYHQPSKPSSLLLRSMADTFGMKVSD